MAFNFKKKYRKAKNMHKWLPARVANTAKRHYLDSFRKEGFTDKKFDPWASRKKDGSKTRENRGGILIDTGALRGSIRVVKARFDHIEVGSVGIDYAGYHNNPDKSNGGKRAQKKRQFVGQSEVLSNKIERQIQQALKKTMR